MTSKTQGCVEVKIDSKTYLLKYGYAAIDAIETKYDMQAGVAVQKIDEGLQHFIFFLKTGLTVHHPEIDEAKIIEMEPLIVPITFKIAEALSIAYVGVIESTAPVKKPKAPKKK